MLPRKLPWAPGELEYVFELVFISNELSDNEAGLRRLKTWMSRGSCPHAVESTASLLDVTILDKSQALSSHQLQLAYSMAIVRMVNGLVDPAQQGAYARSIGAIAQQLGLPLFFVEIRHAATHEDLPSLSLLRDAAKQGLDWLYQQYWLYQIQPAEQTSTSTPSTSSTKATKLNAQLGDLLKQYKALRKQGLKDRSQNNESKMKSIQNQLENLIHTNAQAFRNSKNTNNNNKNDSSNYQQNDFIVLDIVFSILLQEGFLVPLNRKKRVSGKGNKRVPRELVSIWMPLLQWMDETFETSIDTLVYRILDAILLADTNVYDASYYTTLSTWLIHLLHHINDSQVLKEVTRNCLLCSNTYTLRVLEAISSDDELKQESSPLLKSLFKLLQKDANSKSMSDSQVENTLASVDDKLTIIGKRVNDLLSTDMDMDMDMDMDIDTNPEQEEQEESSQISQSQSGWTIADSHSWKPCPIGTLDGAIPAFLPQAFS